MLVVPLAYFWTTADWNVRWLQVTTCFLARWATSLTLLQPYITLAEGNQPASKSILLDYVSVVIGLCPKLTTFQTAPK